MHMGHIQQVETVILLAQDEATYGRVDGNVKLAKGAKKKMRLTYPGLLQSLNIPNQASTNIIMDLIEHRQSQRAKTILVVVDWVTKYSHFLALSHPFTAQSFTRLFLNQVHRLLRMPRSIVTDRNKVFTSQFWQELMKMMGIKLHSSSVYHSQSDGQARRVNQCIENYIRCMAFKTPNAWSKWLGLANWWYDSLFFYK